MELTGSSPHLAGYLAIHHHKNNLAMMFTNPDKKVRLLLSYVLFQARQETDRLTQAIFYRSVISQCHLEFQEVVRKHEVGELNDEDALRLADLFEKKAELAHKRLERLVEVTTNAQN